jgi:hypothetical protein
VSGQFNQWSRKWWRYLPGEHADVGDVVGEGVGAGVGERVGLGVGEGVGLGVGLAVGAGVGIAKHCVWPQVSEVQVPVRHPLQKWYPRSDWNLPTGQ